MPVCARVEGKNPPDSLSLNRVNYESGIPPPAVSPVAVGFGTMPHPFTRLGFRMQTAPSPFFDFLAFVLGYHGLDILSQATLCRVLRLAPVNVVQFNP